MEAGKRSGDCSGTDKDTDAEQTESNKNETVV